MAPEEGGAAADMEFTVEHADRLAQFSAIFGEIFGGELACTARIVLHRGSDIAGDAALIECRGSVLSDGLGDEGRRAGFVSLLYPVGLGAPAGSKK